MYFSSVVSINVGWIDSGNFKEVHCLLVVAQEVPLMIWNGNIP